MTRFALKLQAWLRGWTRPGLPLDRRCRHEAVHVVVALGLGHRVRFADVLQIGSRGGYVDIDYDFAQKATQDCHFDAMAVALGPHTDELAREINDFGSVNDMGNALFHALSIAAINLPLTGYAGPLTLDALIAAARDRAGLIVRSHAGAITRITDLLIARQRVSTAEIERAWQAEADEPVGRKSVRIAR